MAIQQQGALVNQDSLQKRIYLPPGWEFARLSMPQAAATAPQIGTTIAMGANNKVFLQDGTGLSSISDVRPVVLSPDRRPPSALDNSLKGYTTSSLWQLNGQVYQPIYCAADSAAWAPVEFPNGAAATDIMGTTNTKFAGGTVAMKAGYVSSAVDIFVTIGGVYQLFTINILATGELDNIAAGVAFAQADAGTLVYVTKVYDQTGTGNHLALGTATGTPAVVSGTISSTTLTATVTTGAVVAGQFLFGTGVTPGTTIVSGSGPWTLSTASTVSSTTTMYLGTYLPPMLAWDPIVGRYMIVSESRAIKRALQWPQTLSISSAKNMGILMFGRGQTSADDSNTYALSVGDKLQGQNTIAIGSGHNPAAYGQVRIYADGTGSQTTPVPIDCQPCSVLVTSSSTALTFNMNGQVGTMSSVAANALTGGWLYSLSPAILAYTPMMRYAGIAIFNTAPTANQQLSLMASSVARIDARPQVINTLFVGGDSRTVDRFVQLGEGLTTFLARQLGRSWKIISTGVQSDTVQNQVGGTGNGQLSTSLALMKGAGLNYLIYLAGVNDFGINSRTVAQVLADLQTMGTQVSSVGVSEILIAELATTSTVGSNPSTQLPLLRYAIDSAGAKGMNATAIVDVSGAVPVVTPSNTSYYSDGLHPQAPIHGLIASLMAGQVY